MPWKPFSYQKLCSTPHQRHRHCCHHHFSLSLFSLLFYDFYIFDAFYHYMSNSLFGLISCETFSLISYCDFGVFYHYMSNLLFGLFICETVSFPSLRHLTQGIPTAMLRVILNIIMIRLLRLLGDGMMRPLRLLGDGKIGSTIGVLQRLHSAGMLDVIGLHGIMDTLHHLLQIVGIGAPGNSVNRLLLFQIATSLRP